MACKARKREFLLTKARSEELRAAEADAWRKPASATEPSSSARPAGSAREREEGAQRELVGEQPQPQPDVGLRDGSADRGSAQEDANPEQALASVDAGSRVRTAGETCKDSCTFAMMLESDGDLETYTELNAMALDLHELDPETMWSSDLGWVPKSILHEAREKEVKKLQQFETYEEVPLRLRDKKSSVHGLWTSGKKVENLASRGYESSHTDLASLFAATPSVVATRIALVLGLAQDVEMAMADISGAFLHAVLEKHFFVTPPVEYRKPGVVLKIKIYLYGDKRAPRWWQDHFEKTMLELGFERLESEPGCLDTIIVVVQPTTKKCWKAQRPKRVGQLWAS